MINNALLKFQREVCPEISTDDPRITNKLIEEISRLKEENGRSGEDETGNNI